MAPLSNIDLYILWTLSKTKAGGMLSFQNFTIFNKTLSETAYHFLMLAEKLDLKVNSLTYTGNEYNDIKNDDFADKISVKSIDCLLPTINSDANKDIAYGTEKNYELSEANTADGIYDARNQECLNTIVNKIKNEKPEKWINELIIEELVWSDKYLAPITEYGLKFIMFDLPIRDSKNKTEIFLNKYLQNFKSDGLHSEEKINYLSYDNSKEYISEFLMTKYGQTDKKTVHINNNDIGKDIHLLVTLLTMENDKLIKVKKINFGEYDTETKKWEEMLQVEIEINNKLIAESVNKSRSKGKKPKGKVTSLQLIEVPIDNNYKVVVNDNYADIDLVEFKGEKKYEKKLLSAIKEKKIAYDRGIYNHFNGKDTKFTKKGFLPTKMFQKDGDIMSLNKITTGIITDRMFKINQNKNN